MIAPTQGPAHFRPGQLVRHRRYRYRGLIVDVTPFCVAPDEWYHLNQTQPERNQPWYHVLVHGTETVTYAAQTSLMNDDSGGIIEHPLVDAFFSKFTGDAYVRNNRPWTA